MQAITPQVAAVVPGGHSTQVEPDVPSGLAFDDGRDDRRGLKARSDAFPVTRAASFRMMLALSSAIVGVLRLHAAESKTVVVAPKEETALVFESRSQERAAPRGEGRIEFRFPFTNTSAKEVVINQVRTSCSCSIAQLPSQPWHVAAGESGEIVVAVDLRSKSGRVTNTATIDFPASYRVLTFTVVITE